MGVVVGDTVLLPEYGGQTVKLGDEELSLFRDDDILGKFHVSTSTSTSTDVAMEPSRHLHSNSDSIDLEPRSCRAK